MEKFKYYQYVLIEWHNSDHETIKIVSNNPIDYTTVKVYVDSIPDYNYCSDSFVLIDKPKTVVI